MALDPAAAILISGAPLQQSPSLLAGDFLFYERYVPLNVTTPTPICGTSGDRIYLGFFSPNSVRFLISTLASMDGNHALTIPTGGDLVQYFFRTHGTMTQLAWYGMSIAGPGSVGVFEVLFRPKGK